MPLMCSCRKALMRAMAVRMRRLASRTRSRKIQVAMMMRGRTAKVASARRQFIHSMMATKTMQQEGVIDHGGDAGGEEIVEGVHVGGDARDQAADRAAVVETHRQALQVLEDFLAQVVHGFLADLLHDADLQILQGEAQEQRGEKEQGNAAEAAHGRGQRESRGAARGRCSGPRRPGRARGRRRPAGRPAGSAERQ